MRAKLCIYVQKFAEMVQGREDFEIQKARKKSVD